METTFDYLRQFGPLLAERILETYPPLQSTKDPVAPCLAGLLRKPLPAQAVAITGTAKYLRKAKAARIVAGCGAGKTFMALGTIHVLSEGLPTTTLVMCPSHITHKWAPMAALVNQILRFQKCSDCPRKENELSNCVTVPFTPGSFTRTSAPTANRFLGDR